MNSKQFKLLIVVTIAVVGLGAFLLTRERSSWQNSNQKIGGKVFDDFPLNDIAAITIKTTSNEVAVAKSGDIWTVVDREKYPANFDTISGLIRKVWELKEMRNVPVGASQLAGLELVEPGNGDSRHRGLANRSQPFSPVAVTRFIGSMQSVPAKIA